MRKRSIQTAMGTVVLVAVGGVMTAAGELVLIDFGNDASFRGTNVVNPDPHGRYWNSVHSGAFYGNMIDVSNRTTTVDLGFDATTGTDSFNGPGGVYDDAALGAFGVTNAVNDYYINARFQIQGLQVARTYTLTFFGSHKISTDDATTYALCTDNSYATVLLATNLLVQVPGSPWLHNTNRLAAVSNVVPRAGGYLFISVIGANGNAGYLNALSIEREKLTPVLAVTAAPTVDVGSPSVTLTGSIAAAGPVYATNGSRVAVTINGVTQHATVSGGAGAFSIAFPSSTLPVGAYPVTYAYAGDGIDLFGATNNATVLTVNPLYRTVLIDFGNDASFRGTNVVSPDPNGRTWNSVHSGAFYANMADVSNQATTVDLGFDAAPGTDSFNGPGGDFDASALGMLGVTNAVNDYYIDSRFQLQGLETGLTYRLTFFGSKKFSTDDATTYSVCEDNTYATTLASVNLNVQVPGSPWIHNRDTVAVLDNVVPQPSGRVFVKFAGANGNSGYLNAMKVEWVRGAPSITGVSASQSIAYGTGSITLTGLVGAAGGVYPAVGESVAVTINGVTQNATVSAAGAFSVNFTASSLNAGTHTVTYLYAGNTVLTPATNTATTLTVTKLTPVIGVNASPGVEAGTASVTLTGVVAAAGPVVPANGSTVAVTINGVTQNATISGGAGAFSLSFPVASLSVGIYPITYTYAGNATALFGATNNASSLTVQVDAETTTILVDFGRHDGVNGNATASPDLNGNAWNNLSSRAADNVVTNATRFSGMSTIGGDPTPVGVQITSSGWLANGRLNGGLFAPNGPSGALLGRFAIETATEDYFFITGAGVTETLKITGLNPDRLYNLRFFGTRDIAQTRQTTYTADGQSVVLTTSGTGIGDNGLYSGNDDDIAVLSGLSPDVNGELALSAQATQGGFGYLGILEIVDAAGHCLNGTTPTIPSVANQVVYATGSATLTFQVTGLDAEGCAGPDLVAHGLPVGASFSATTSSNVTTGTFSWTPTVGQVGTYPVRFEAGDVNEAGTASRVVMVYVGQSGEGSSGGIPNSQTNWSVSITELTLPVSGNATLVWEAVDGVAYDVYASDQPIGGGASWSPVVNGQIAPGGQLTSAVTATGMKFYQVVPHGMAPTERGAWGVVPLVIASGYSMVHAPVELDDLSLQGAGSFGELLATELDGNHAGTADRIMIREANGSWTTVYLDGNGAWSVDVTLARGQGFFIYRSGASVTQAFTGAVSAKNQTTAVATGWNIIGPSIGRSHSFSALSSSLQGSPAGGWEESTADLIVIDEGGGNFRRIMKYNGSPAWLDLKSFSSPNITIAPGKAIYYLKRGASGVTGITL